MLDQLPPELRLQILKLCPSLDSLWSFVRASPSMSHVFDMYPLEIAGVVLDQTVPLQTLRLMRGVLRARVASNYPASVSAARRIATIGPSTIPPTDNTGTSLSASAQQSRMVRSFLATAGNIHTWSHACLDHLIRRSLELRPSTLVKLGPGYTPHQQYQEAESQEEQYQPQKTGPPSWVEEQRMIKAFWRLEFFLGLQSAGARGRLGEHKDKEENEDVDSDLDEQLLTAYDFYLSVTQTSASTSTSPASNISLRDDAGGLPIITQIKGVDSVASCPEQPSYELNQDVFHQGPLYLDTTPNSYHFQDHMCNRDRRYSPLHGVPFEPYRKFGFALWDNQRMADLGFRAPGKSSVFKNREFYYFRWRSILTKEELALSTGS